jgi:hypothetical protein
VPHCIVLQKGQTVGDLVVKGEGLYLGRHEVPDSPDIAEEDLLAFMKGLEDIEQSVAL